MRDKDGQAWLGLLDLQRERAQVIDEVQPLWDTVLSTMQLHNGPQVAAFENEIAAYTGVGYAIGVASGTDALILALRALELDREDEVILTANAFAADIEAILLGGAQPILIDIDEDGLGPDIEQLASAISPRTKAVLLVHLHGAPLPLDDVLQITDSAALPLIEDGSHAHGASRHGRKVGSFGSIGCFSAGVVKNLAAFGDAGYVTVADSHLNTRIRLLARHGQENKNHHLLYGCNSRLDELQAAVLRIKLRHLEARNQRRRAIAAFYCERFADLDLGVPSERPGEVHAYHQFVLRSSQRDLLASHMRSKGIETGIHYPVPLHRQPSWSQRYGETPSLPRAEKLAAEILSIPVFPDLTDAEAERVAAAVRSFFT